MQFNEDGGKGSSNAQSEDYKLIIDMSSDIEIEAETEDEQPENEVQDEPPRRSRRQRKPPNYYGREQCHLTETPTTFKDANASQDKAKWKVAMEKEMKFLQENNVWDLVELGRLLAASGSSRRKPELTAQLKGTKQDWWHKAILRDMEWIMMKLTAQW